MDQQLHRRGRQTHANAALVAPVDQLDRLDLREVRVGDDDLVYPLGAEHISEIRERSECTQSVGGNLRQGKEPHDLDRRVRRIREGVGYIADVLARADEHGAPPVAGGAEHHAGQPFVDGPQGGDVEERKAERPVEDVEAREALSAHKRKHDRNERDLEQTRHDAREARAQGACRVEARASEQQGRDEIGEREDAPCLVHDLGDIQVAQQRRLEDECREDRE